MHYLAITLANFMYIFLKAFQQRNVAHLHYGWAMATNLFLVVAELTVIGYIAVAATGGNIMDLLYTGAAMTLGGGSGCLASMYLHSKYITRKE